MEEGHRAYYLKTLGIHEYLPRDLAEDNGIFEGEVLQPAFSKSLSDQVDEQTSAEQVIASFDAPTDSPRDVPYTEVEPVSEVGVVSSGKKSDSIVDIELQLALWQPTDELLVCTVVDRSLPDPNQIQLLSNILVAMGQGQGNLPQMEIAQWPPYPNAEGGEPEVREFLATVIQARLGVKNSKMMLILGMDTAGWVLTEGQVSKIANGQTDVFDGIVGLVIPSLTEMIENPQCKRKTWNTIRFLSPFIKSNQTNTDD